MSSASATCWTLIEAAAAGQTFEREEFCRRYGPLVERTLAKRWSRTQDHPDVADGVQDVLWECMKQGGALERAGRGPAGGFRGFLFGITRNVARRHEAARARLRTEALSEVEEPGSADAALERVFDRAWAESLVREAGDRLRRWAEQRSPAARRRVQILELRFGRGWTESGIAQHFGVPTKRIEKDFAVARGEFQAMLRQIVAWHGGGEAAELEEECRELLDLLALPSDEPSS